MLLNQFMVGAVISAVISIILLYWGIPYLRKLKYKQTVREEGPKAHLIKNGTPTMGGIFFVISIAVTSFFVLNKDMSSVYPIVAMLGFCYIGWKDDYIKVVKQNNLGLTPKQKMAYLIVVSGFLSVMAYKIYGSIILLPVIGEYIDIGIWYIPFMMLVYVGASNAVNLTDGLDGLATSVTIVAVMFIGFLAYIFGFTSQYVLSGIVIGALFGFLLFNLNPAKIFMGDTGSLALGGLLVGFSVAIKMPLILIAIGIVYIIETLSVIIQVLVFKTTKKRVFKMSPIHHHFEMCGLSENKIVTMAVSVAILGGIVSLLIV